MKTAAEGEEKQEEEQEPEEEESKEGLLAKLAQANPYTVLLGIALAALTLGVICLLLELKAYNFDWKAEGARSQLPAPVRYETPSMTTAAASAGRRVAAGLAPRAPDRRDRAAGS